MFKVHFAGLTALTMIALPVSQAEARSRIIGEDKLFIPMSRIAVDPPRGFTEMCRRNALLCEKQQDAAGSSADNFSRAAQQPDPVPPLAVAAQAPQLAALAPAINTVRLSWLENATPIASGRAIRAMEASRLGGALAAAATAALLQGTDGLEEGDLPKLDMRMLKRINRLVNNHVRQESDSDAFGIAEMWRPSGTGKGAVGDCEDLALQKQIELRRAHYPANATMIAVVYHHEYGLHTVLVVRTQSGDYVLDNMTGAIRHWSQTHYSWLRIQSPDDPSIWRRLA